MACTKCATAGAHGAENTVQPGSTQGGAHWLMAYPRKKVTVFALRAPSTVIFTENPFLAVNDKFAIQNIDTLEGAMNGLVECVTVTATPALVDGRWEVVTDLAMTSLTGAPTISLTGTNNYNFSGVGCPAPVSEANTIKALICAGQLNAANFVGSVYTQKPGGAGLIFDAFIVSGSSEITVNRRVGIKAGHKISLAGTAVVDATIIKLTNGTRSDGGQITVATLDTVVTGVSVPPLANGTICVAATAVVAEIAKLVFTVVCNCLVRVSLPASVTNNSEKPFPLGTPYEASTCGQTQYCYTIHDFTVGAKKTDYFGTIVL